MQRPLPVATTAARPLTEPLPAVVACLGYGGLLPFLALASGAIGDGAHAQFWRAALVAYGAVILSFVGALHWGLAIAPGKLDRSRRNALFVCSVVPALVAWIASLLAPMFASGLLVVGFLAHYWQDRRLIGQAGLPAWYLPLRLRLTVVACLCLFAGGFIQFG